jgi:hypothetical protein
MHKQIDTLEEEKRTLTDECSSLFCCFYFSAMLKWLDGASGVRLQAQVHSVTQEANDDHQRLMAEVVAVKELYRQTVAAAETARQTLERDVAAERAIFETERAQWHRDRESLSQRARIADVWHICSSFEPFLTNRVDDKYRRTRH